MLITRATGNTFHTNYNKRADGKSTPKPGHYLFVRKANSKSREYNLLQYLIVTKLD